MATDSKLTTSRSRTRSASVRRPSHYPSTPSATAVSPAGRTPSTPRGAANTIAIATSKATSTSFSATQPPCSERCQIHSRGSGYIAAVIRTTPDEPTGLIFRQCRLTAEPGLLRSNPQTGGSEAPFPPKDSGKGVFLGRPWRDFARTVYIDCWMGEHIRPEGWDNWGIPGREKTAWFAESGSSGPGPNPSARVAWAQTLTPATAAAFAPEVFLKGSDGWNPTK